MDYDESYMTSQGERWRNRDKQKREGEGTFDLKPTDSDAEIQICLPVSVCTNRITFGQICK